MLVELPDSGTVFISVKDSDKDNIVVAAKMMVDHGFKIIATGGTASHLEGQGLPVERVNKVAQGRPHIVDRLTDEPSLKTYHLLPSVRGDLLAKVGRFDEARAEFERAASLTRNARERDLLLERAAACARGEPPAR